MSNIQQPRAADPMSAAELAAWAPAPRPGARDDPGEPLRAALRRLGLWTGRQVAGRRWPIGCVALEITQRCNLDCRLCYLSDSAEAVHDLPLAEVYRRIDGIRHHYGPGTDVQVTGGDPTLRDRAELTAIVRRIRALGMRPSLMTNGIRASRALLAELAAAGLADVAFHVDTTQDRPGHTSESSLDAVRADYVARARGLGLAVHFNTTVHDGNLDEVPAVVAFMRRNADVVSLAAFQLQADTGRGVLRRAGPGVTPEGVAGRIAAGAGTPLSFDAVMVGHPGCNRYALGLEVNGRMVDALPGARAVERIIAATAGRPFDRQSRRRTVAALLAGLARRPAALAAAAGHAVRLVRRLAPDLLAARFRVNPLAFLIHDFMDADRLDRDRCAACIFMAMTGAGPVSMCVHNAKRDAFILQPVTLRSGARAAPWHPLSGGAETVPAAPLPAKRLKGRRRVT